MGSLCGVKRSRAVLYVETWTRHDQVRPDIFAAAPRRFGPFAAKRSPNQEQEIEKGRVEVGVEELEERKKYK